MTQQNDPPYRVNNFVLTCGHISTALYTEEDGTKIPVCMACLKSKPELAKKIADLHGRLASCVSCGNFAPSSPNLFSFIYTGGEYDSYYDGCQG